MKKYSQLVFGEGYGDCFRACMATILQLPIEVLPNDHSPMWPFAWKQLLRQFGLETVDGNAQGPIWLEGFWIASVPSLNLPAPSTHAIVMHNTSRVFHDPSRRKRYRAGTNMLGKNIVIGGTHLIVEDASRLHRLDEYRQKLAGTIGKAPNGRAT